MPLYTRNRTLLAKTEVSYGVDPTPTGAANAILAIDLRLSPMEGADKSRNLEWPFMGPQPTVAADLHAKLAFKVELEASGTAGTAPAWGPLMRACGFAQTIVASTSVTYSPVSSAFESATLYFNVDGTLFKLLGGRGNVTVEIDASEVPHLAFEFTGLWVQPADQAKPSVTLTSWIDPKVAGTVNTPVFTLGAFSPLVRSFRLNAGNRVEPRFLIGGSSVLITGREDAVEMTIEAVPLATFNPFSLAEAGTTVALTVTHGTVAGRRSTVSVPRLQIQRPQTPAEAQGVVEWPLRGVPLPTGAGNNQWTLALT